VDPTPKYFLKEYVGKHRRARKPTTREGVARMQWRTGDVDVLTYGWTVPSTELPDAVRFHFLDVARELEVHLVLDNLSAHKAPEVMELARRSQTCSAGICTSRPPRVHGSTWSSDGFSSVPALVEAIEIWAERWNDDPKPFIWHKAANDLIEKGAPRKSKAPPDQSRDGPLDPEGKISWMVSETEVTESETRGPNPT
jgi:hypothetical protein